MSGTTGISKGVVLPYWSRLAITRNFLVGHLGDLPIALRASRHVLLRPWNGGGSLWNYWIRAI